MVSTGRCTDVVTFIKGEITPNLYSLQIEKDWNIEIILTNMDKIDHNPS